MNIFKWFKKRKQIEFQDSLNILRGNIDEKQKKKLITDTLQTCGNPLMVCFYICEIKNSMTGHLYNAPTDEYFEISFRRLPKEEVKQPVNE